MERDKHESIPSWSGTPETFDTYKVQVKYFLKSKPSFQQSQQIAKLIRQLRGRAWELIEKLPETSKEKLEKSQEIFFNFLKKHLLEGELPELGRCFKNYLQLRRSRKESMQLYIMRNRGALEKLEKAMRIVEGEELKDHLVEAIKGIAGLPVPDADNETYVDDEG